jgi:hypothetical protein
MATTIPTLLTERQSRLLVLYTTIIIFSGKQMLSGIAFISTIGVGAVLAFALLVLPTVSASHLEMENE